jgi:hypothetical protein
LADKRIIDRIPLCKIYPKYGISPEDNYYKIEDSDINHGFYVYATDSLIYARPIEFTLDMLRAGESHNGFGLRDSNLIKVYDWDGNLIEKYEMDTLFYSFIVDEINRIIYIDTIDLETGDPIIRKYLI